jgi:hypothetical protein
MEIHLHNPWLTYGIGLHRLREAGLLPDIIDGLDEHPFTLDQLYEFCHALFIGDKSGVKLPHPRKDSLTSFFQTLKMLVDKEEMQWNPVRKKMMPWIDLKRLEASHHRHHQDREYQRSKSDNSKSPQGPKEAYGQKQGQSCQQKGLPPPPFRVSRQPSTPPCNPLQRFLLTVPQRFPPTSTTVEMHEYFSKWKTFDDAAFDGFSGDELAELLRKGSYSTLFAIVHLLQAQIEPLTMLILFTTYPPLLCVHISLFHQQRRRPNCSFILTNYQRI